MIIYIWSNKVYQFRKVLSMFQSQGQVKVVAFLVCIILVIMTNNEEKRIGNKNQVICH